MDSSLCDMDAISYSGFDSVFSASFSIRKIPSRFGSFQSFSSAGSARFYDAKSRDNRAHFLEACSLCRKTLGVNRDIFMYRGDTPFCSEECRQLQIEMDEAKDKKTNLSSSSSTKALRKEKKKQKNYALRTGAIAAA